MKRLLTLLLFSNLLLSLLQAQPVHRIRGTVIEKNSRQPLEFINVMVLGLNKGGVTNAEGHFTIEQVPPGIYRLQATAIGYKSVTTPEYILSTKDLNISIEMEENLTELAGVTVTASPFRRDLESPVSLRIIGLQEIEKSPGANRDISRIVQSYPGVAFSPIGYRNDLIVRGGSPSENRFYLDGVEIPNINHFSTQGASGGPVGILNADLIREVNFYTGAFPVCIRKCPWNLKYRSHTDTDCPAVQRIRTRSCQEHRIYAKCRCRAEDRAYIGRIHHIFQNSDPLCPFADLFHRGKRLSVHGTKHPSG